MSQLIVDMIGLVFVLILITLGFMCVFSIYELLKHYKIEITDYINARRKDK